MITPINLIKDKNSLPKNEILLLSRIHQEKIKISDAILVINKDGYIGNVTRNEIEFAKSLNKEIIYYTDLINGSK